MTSSAVYTVQEIGADIPELWYAEQEGRVDPPGVQEMRRDSRTRPIITMSMAGTVVSQSRGSIQDLLW